MCVFVCVCRGGGGGGGGGSDSLYPPPPLWIHAWFSEEKIHCHIFHGQHMIFWFLSNFPAMETRATCTPHPPSGSMHGSVRKKFIVIFFMASIWYFGSYRIFQQWRLGQHAQKINQINFIGIRKHSIGMKSSHRTVTCHMNAAYTNMFLLQ